MPVGGPGGGPQSVQFTRKRLEELSVDLWRRCRLPLDQDASLSSVNLHSMVHASKLPGLVLFLVWRQHDCAADVDLKAPAKLLLPVVLR
eukprot:scaffold322646_cov17-Tisochrysis_lutea.AAC.1